MPIFTVEDNALVQSWAPEVCWCNPPYFTPGDSRTDPLRRWIPKAYEESQRGATVVLIVPVRSERDYWQRCIIATGAEVRFLPGRTRFASATGTVQSMQGPCALVIFRPPPGIEAS